MKIAIDIRNIGKRRTGDEVWAFSLVKNLSKVDPNNDYFLLTGREASGDKNLAEAIERLELGKNFKVVALAKNGANRFWWNAFLAPRFLNKNKIDVFHTQYIVPFFVSRKTKIVTTIHDISFNFFPQFINKLDLLFLKTLIPWSLKRADKILGVSKFTSSEIINYYKTNPDKVSFVYNAASENFINFYKKILSDEELKLFKEKYSIPEKYILYVGTHEPRKNVPFLMEAFSRLIKNPGFGDIKLVIVGNPKAHNRDPRIGEKLRELSLDKEVVFTGYVADRDMPAVFKNASLFASASLYEGFGIPILEAFITGVPVVCAKASCFPEIARDAALLIDPGDVEMFSKAMYDVLNKKDLEESLRARGFRRAEFFSWEKSARETLKIYEQLKP